MLSTPHLMLTKVCDQVKGLQFNAFSLNLLALGAGNSDLSTQSAAVLYAMLEVNHAPQAIASHMPSRGEPIRRPAGRRRHHPPRDGRRQRHGTPACQQIFAATTSTGSTVVWLGPEEYISSPCAEDPTKSVPQQHPLPSHPSLPSVSSLQ
jgi:hypothetical protein